MTNRNQKIKDEVAALTLEEVLTESLQWFEITTRELPDGWAPALPTQHKLLRELRDIVADIDGDKRDPRYYPTKARLSLYCEKLRRCHDGEPPPAGAAHGWLGHMMSLVRSTIPWLHT